MKKQNVSSPWLQHKALIPVMGKAIVFKSCFQFLRPILQQFKQVSIQTKLLTLKGLVS